MFVCFRFDSGSVVKRRMSRGGSRITPREAKEGDRQMTEDRMTPDLDLIHDRGGCEQSARRVGYPPNPSPSILPRPYSGHTAGSSIMTTGSGGIHEVTADLLGLGEAHGSGSPELPQPDEVEVISMIRRSERRRSIGFNPLPCATSKPAMWSGDRKKSRRKGPKRP